MQFIPIDIQIGENAHKQAMIDTQKITQAQTVRNLIYSSLSVTVMKQKGANYMWIYELYMDGYLTSADVEKAYTVGVISQTDRAEILSSREAKPKVYRCTLEKSYGLVDGEHDHNYVAVTTVSPTCTEAGVETLTCSVCGKTNGTSVLAALGHDWGEWTVVDADTEQRICTRCGAKETQQISIDDEGAEVDDV